ncbi:MAG: helix-turn-helix domain-containing protein [Candidatus Methanomethylicaceae archaeon]
MTIDNGLIEEIRRLRREGLTISAISKALGISRPTVYKVLNESEAPEGSHEIKHKGSLVSKPHLKAIPVENPSNQLKRVREETEATLLEVDRARALKELEALTRRPPLSLEEKKAMLEEARVDLELRKLKAEDLQNEERKKRAELIEEIKSQVWPKHFRMAFPSVINFRVLSRVTEELERLNTKSLDEALSYAKIVRDAVLSEFDSEVVHSSTIRAIGLGILDHLQQIHEEYGKDKTFDDFLSGFLLELMRKDPGALIDLLTNLTAFVNTVGSEEQRGRFDSKIKEVIRRLEMGGDANGKGLSV